MKKNVIRLAGLLSLIVILIAACNKGDDIVAPQLSAEEILLAQDDLAADDIYNEVDASIQDKLVELTESGFQSISQKSAEDDFTCLVVTVDYPDSTRFPKVITFDYGSGCRIILRNDTIFKEGKVIVTLTDHMFNPGAQRIVTFEDFYVNEMKVEGLITNTYVGLNERDLHEFTMLIEDGKLTFADEEGNRLEYTREADYTRFWDRERRMLEDTLYMQGSMWGLNVEGVRYSREIVETLTMIHCPDYGRRWVIIDGVVMNTLGDEVTTTDFSEGGCDGTADIYRQGQHNRIRIRTHHRMRHHTGGNTGGGNN